MVNWLVLDCVCVCVCVGLNTGSYYAIGTLLNPIVLHYFPVSNTFVINIVLYRIAVTYLLSQTVWVM